MLFMGPQMVLDLFAQFKQSLEQVTEALALQRLPPAPRILLSATRGSNTMPPAMGHGPGPARGSSSSTWELPHHKSHRALSTLQNLDLELSKRDAPEQSEGSHSLSSGKSTWEQQAPKGNQQEATQLHSTMYSRGNFPHTPPFFFKEKELTPTPIF